MGFNTSVGIGWPASSYTGWGVYGLNLTLQLLEMKRNPVWLSAPVDLEMNDTFLSIAKKQTLLEEVATKTGSLEFDFPVLFDFPAGHEELNMPIILGRDIIMDVNNSKSTIDFL